MAVCVAVVGKENSPLYICCASPEQELSLHYTLHTSLDVVDERSAGGGGGKPGESRELYLGALHSSEHQKVFGYVTNTKIKFLIVVESGNTTLRDNDIRQMFRKLHTAYTNVMANPFYSPGERIDSGKFDTTVKSILGIKQN